jgi:Ca2+-binding RTX toxin-like protein
VTVDQIEIVGVGAREVFQYLLDAGVSCFQQPPPSITTFPVSASYGGGDDFHDADSVCDGPFADVVASHFVDGGAGADSLNGDLAGDRFDGGADGDRLSGRGGNDVLDGGTGNDLVSGGAGDDDLRGGSEDDVLDGGPGRDVLRGGPGRDEFVGGADGPDTVTYQEETQPVSVTIGSLRNDGVLAGGVSEGDSVPSDVETVIGGSAGDALTVSDGFAHTLVGAGGDDTLRGGGAPAVLDGGAGVDTLVGGPASDTVLARDGILDRIDCGGGIDTLVADLADVGVVRTSPIGTRTAPGTVVQLARNCENLITSPVDDGPPGRAEAVALTAASVSVTLACPAKAKVACAGRLSLRDKVRKGRLLARGFAYAVEVGASAVVDVPLGADVLAGIGARGRIVVEAKEQGVSKKGPRSSRALLPITAAPSV